MADLISRRTFAAEGMALLGCPGSEWVRTAFAGAEQRSKLTDAQRSSLLAALAEWDARYDPAARMIRTEASKIGYHTTVSTGHVHPTRGSLAYAVALLDSGQDQRLQRAVDVLRAVIPLQDTNPKSKTYGIWSWYLEEPLDRMSPPDWNWADFCGVQLLAAWIDHRDRLGEELAGHVRQAILHAARSIERRNMGPWYTNIAVMGTYVTLVTAERFGLADLGEYAKKRLRRLHRYVIEQGSFTEYNSPTYSLVAIAELARMLAHVRDGDDRRLAAEIHDLAWKHVATHFHPPTRQWAGPHSRCYHTDLRKSKEYLAFLEAGTKGRADLVADDPLPLSLYHYRVPLRCPEKYVSSFTELKTPRQVIETFIKARPQRSGHTNPVVGTTYLHPRFALGTVNRGDFWNQKRSLLAYWGTAAKPTYLHLRCLHDGYDFCSGLLFTVQHEGAVLGTVVFATDYGDTHPGLDKIRNATIRAKDLRLRFEFGADVGDLEINTPIDPANEICISDRNVQLTLKPLGDVFGEKPFRWETGREGQTAWIDAVAYSGDEKAINLASLPEAYLAFALSLQFREGKDVSPGAPRLTKANQRLESVWKVGRRTLQLEVPAKPDKRSILNDAFLAAIE